MNHHRNTIALFLIVLIIAGCTNNIYTQKEINVENTATVITTSTSTYIEAIKSVESTATIALANTVTPKEAGKGTAMATVNNDYCTQDKLATIIKGNKLSEEDVRNKNIYINKEKIKNLNADELAAVLFCQWLALLNLDGYRVNHLKITEPKNIGLQIPDTYYVIIYYSVLPATSQNSWSDDAMEIMPDGWIIKRPIINCIYLFDGNYYLQMII